MHSRITDLRLLGLATCTALLCLGQVCVSPGAGGGDTIPAVPVDAQPQVTIETSMGDIVVELFSVQAPQTVSKFLKLVDEKYYDGLVFHEVRSGRSIAAGDYDTELAARAAGDPVPNESNNGLTNRRGRVAWVEPSGTGSGASRFLINLANDATADFSSEAGTRGRTVFGRVIRGMDVADGIGALQTSSQTAGDGTTLANLPTNRLPITSIVRRTGDSDGTTEPGENRAPTAVAGLNRNIVAGLIARLDASNSRDPNGDALTYRWTQTAGPTVQLSNTSAAQATFEVPASLDAYTFELTVDDGREATSTTSVTLTTIQQPVVRLKTTLGDVVFDMLTDAAPVTTRNFMQYAEDGFYNGTIFHRVMTNFVVQGGGFRSGLVAQTGLRDAIVNEFGADRSNLRGTVAMAKREADPNSATSQFFVNLKDNSENLDAQNGGFTVFARVIEGMNVVDAISVVETGTQQNPQGQSFTDVPVTDVIVQSATIEPRTLSQSFTTTASGLQYRDLAIGTGDLVTPDSTIRALYVGHLTDESGAIFDSSTDPESPAEFALSGLIDGWQEGLGDIPIRVGGKRILIIPPELGYGDAEQPSIPANSTLWFEIEVLDVAN